MSITLRRTQHYSTFLSVLLILFILVLHQLHYSFTIAEQYRLISSSSSSLSLTENNATSTTLNNTPASRIVDNNNKQNNNFFGACLMIKEDNDLLVEWLAYHYTVLPLRYVVVGSDMNNTQDPNDILRRWSNTDLHYTVFNDTQFMYRHGYRTLSDFILKNKNPRNDSSNSQKVIMKTAAHHFFIHRQLGFITTCSEWMKRQGIEWVTYIDSDEFIVLNRIGKDDERFQIGGPPHYNSIQQIPYDRRKSIPPAEQNTTVLDVIHNVLKSGAAAHDNNYNSSWTFGPCYTMPRLIIGALENETCSNAEPTSHYARDNGFPISEMSTLRFFQHAKKGDFQANRFGKVFVNLANLTEEEITSVRPQNPHRPFRSVCGPAMVHFPESLFYLNHYIGSWERYNSRSDNRRSRQEWELRAYYNDGISCDKDVHDWFPRFVEAMGVNKAKHLLLRPEA